VHGARFWVYGPKFVVVCVAVHVSYFACRSVSTAQGGRVWV